MVRTVENKKQRSPNSLNLPKFIKKYILKPFSSRQRDEQNLYQAELLSALSFCYVIALTTIWLLFMLPPLPIDAIHRETALQGISFSLVASIFAYVMSRTRYSFTGALILATGNTAAIVYVILASRDEQHIERMLASATPWLAFSILVCGLTLSKRAIYTTIGTIFLVCSILSFFIGVNFLHDYLVKLVFLATISAMAIVWVILRDKSALREDEHQAKMVAGSRMSALGEMAGSIAHEINSPLATISLLSSQLQELIEDESINRPVVKEMTTEIEATTLRIAKIIRGLLLFSRDESHDPFRSTRILKIVEDTLAFCIAKFKHREIRLIINEISDSVHAECRGSQISQVLLNLLNNASDAVEELSEKWVALSVVDLDNAVEIAITDSGSGIPLPVQQKLFQPFFTTKEIGKGTGLGLGISKKLIESHGGSLSLDTKSKNTRFVLLLPKTQKQDHRLEAHRNEQ